MTSPKSLSNNKNTMRIIFLFTLISFSTLAQKTENVILITLDGLRWQEVFTGADEVILNDKNYTESIEKTTDKFWDEESNVRREMLMPFLWSKVKHKGVIAGNRSKGSQIDIKNSYAFSYPGYNEILTGYPDEAVDSNDKINNKNVTVLEYLNKLPKYQNRVAAFCTWNVFPYIINQERSGVYVNSADNLADVTGTDKEAWLNELEESVPSLASNRFDFVTFYRALDYLETKKPKMLYIAFDETDEFAHEAKYREYLYAANSIDGYIKKVWDFCQSDPQYKDKTTLIITSDHGRGDADKSQWTSHGKKVPDGGSIWLAAIGPDTPASGEIDFKQQNHQNQIAASIAALLGENYQNGHEIGKPIDWLMRKK